MLGHTSSLNLVINTSIARSIHHIAVVIGRKHSIGVSVIAARVAAVTVSRVEPAIPLAAAVAVRVVAPTATLVASPLLPEALLTPATVASEEVHVTELDRSWVELSLYVPVAVNDRAVPRRPDGV